MKNIELMGLPGSGKSFLFKDTVVSNINLIDEKEFYSKCKKMRKMVKILSFIICFIRFFDIYFLMMFFSVFYSSNKKYSINNTISFMKYMPLYRIIVITNSNNIFVFDQGLIQYIWSISMYNKKIKNSKVLIYCMKRCIKKFHIEVVYYYVNYKKIVERIKSRSPKSVFDILSKDVLIDLYTNHLDDYKFYFNNGIIMYIIHNKSDFLNYLGSVINENEK